MTRTVGFLSAACMTEGNPDARADHWEHDREFEPMRAACAELGIDLRVVVWDDRSVDVADYDAFVIGTTWDYAERPAAFLRRLGEIGSERPLFNPLDFVRWNLDKTYLRDLDERGVRVVPTVWCDDARPATIARAIDELGVDEVVVKPQVGASAWRQARVRRGTPMPDAAELPPDRAMIQPFLPSAATEGEYSFVFFDGDFSHAAQKVPRAGDYRVQSMYGAREHVHEPADGELAAARDVVAAVGERLLYARVDMMRGLDGELAVMELELVEPYLYPEQGPGMGRSFAAALARLIAA